MRATWKFRKVGKLTVSRAKLVCHRDTISQTVGSSHEVVETTIKVDQRARNGAASLTGEQSMTLLVQSNLLHEGTSHLGQVSSTGPQGGGATQGQVVNEPESAVQGKILSSPEESIKCSSVKLKAAVQRMKSNQCRAESVMSFCHRLAKHKHRHLQHGSFG